MILVLGGAFTKGAGTLPLLAAQCDGRADSGDAFLHSATMVKAGVFLMARMNPALGRNRIFGSTL